MKTRKQTSAWLLLFLAAVVVAAIVLLVDFDQVLQKEQTDEEFNTLENNTIEGETKLEGEDALESAVNIKFENE